MAKSNFSDDMPDELKNDYGQKRGIFSFFTARKLDRINRELNLIELSIGDYSREKLGFDSYVDSLENRAAELKAEKRRLEAKINKTEFPESKKTKASYEFGQDRIKDYALLLLANASLVKSKFQKEAISRSDEVSSQFKKYVDGSLFGKDREEQLERLNEVMAYLSTTMNDAKSTTEKLITAFRKPGASTARLVLGLALMAGGIAIHGLTIGAIGLSIAPMIAAPAAVGTLLFGIGVGLGVVGRFLGADALYDKIHLMVTGRAKNGETAVAARVFRNHHSGIDRSIEKIYENEEKAISTDEIDSAFMKYANNIRKNKLWKAILSSLAAIVPPVILNFIGMDSILPSKPSTSHTLPVQDSSFVDKPFPVRNVDGIGHFDPKATMPIDGARPALPAASHLGDAAAGQAQTFVVPDGGGFWHIGKAIASQNLSGFENLPLADRTIVVDTIKNYLVENQANLGITPSETIANPISAKSPWLLKNADLVFTKSDWQQVSSRFPSRIMDALGAKSLPLPSAPVRKLAGAASKLARIA